MNKLWIRLSIIFSGIILLSLVASTLVVEVFVRQTRPIDPLRLGLQAMDNTALVLSQVYEETGSWDGAGRTIEDMLRFVNVAVPEQPGEFQSGWRLSLIDEVGQLAYGPDVSASGIFLVRTVSIRVDGETVGKLVLSREGNPALIILTTAMVPLFWVLFIGGTIGVLSGVLVSRVLTIPLDALATAVRKTDFTAPHQEIIVDGTDEVRDLARAFNDMTARLQEKEKLRQSMVTDVAHELRTPLSMLQGNLYAILDDMYPLNKEEIGKLYQQTQTLTELVENLRIISRAEADELDLNVASLDLKALVRDIASAFQPIADDKQIALEVAASEAEIVIPGDAKKLAQVFRNLIDNALVYTPDGGTIKVDVQQQGQHAVVDITDTGIGISQEHLPHIFERFYRADRARSRHTGGTGIGLAIVRAIVLAHDGTITVESQQEPPSGTNFHVKLPM
jgi:signal transduction histidine kinase